MLRPRSSTGRESIHAPSLGQVHKVLGCSREHMNTPTRGGCKIPCVRLCGKSSPVPRYISRKVVGGGWSCPAGGVARHLHFLALAMVVSRPVCCGISAFWVDRGAAPLSVRFPLQSGCFILGVTVGDYSWTPSFQGLALWASQIAYIYRV